jgi:hypothetical protein
MSAFSTAICARLCREYQRSRILRAGSRNFKKAGRRPRKDRAVHIWPSLLFSRRQAWRLSTSTGTRPDCRPRAQLVRTQLRHASAAASALSLAIMEVAGQVGFASVRYRRAGDPRRRDERSARDWHRRVQEQGTRSARRLADSGSKQRSRDECVEGCFKCRVAGSLARSLKQPRPIQVRESTESGSKSNAHIQRTQAQFLNTQHGDREMVVP